jgi:Protein of unknown function (DUF1440).
MSILESLIRGGKASAIGTLAMDTLLYRRYKKAGGSASFFDWESSDGVESWDSAPAPALVAKQLLERVTGRDLSSGHARTLNNVTHWGFGLAAGAAYAVLARSRTPSVWYGLPFGAAVWASGYVVLPRLGVYKPIWRYDLKTLEQDFTAHLVFGTATASAFRLLAPGDRPRDDGEDA